MPLYRDALSEFTNTWYVAPSSLIEPWDCKSHNPCNLSSIFHDLHLFCNQYRSKQNKTIAVLSVYIAETFWTTINLENSFIWDPSSRLKVSFGFIIHSKDCDYIIICLHFLIDSININNNTDGRQEGRRRKGQNESSIKINNKLALVACQVN